jgi:hypothetical protein
MRTRDLHAAAYDADADQVRAFLRSGADANEFDERGYTPLLWATFRGAVGDQIPVVLALAEAGADLNVVTGAGDSTALVLFRPVPGQPCAGKFVVPSILNTNFGRPDMTTQHLMMIGLCASAALSCGSTGAPPTPNPPSPLSNSAAVVSEDRSCLKDGRPDFDRALSKPDLDEIATIVRAKDRRPLLSVRLVEGRVEARTGRQCGSLSGNGLIITLQKRGGVWAIAKEEEWEF